jgi:demethylmenaquinone methyltransferase/2-methoxy-6-polyprenyl-1,4-benzoquinol methylase
MIDYFDRLAAVYDRFIAPPDHTRLASVLGLPAAGPLLDAAGGTGSVSFPLHPRAGATVVADLSRGMLTQAQKKGFTLLAQARLEALPFRTASFSRILLVDALHHVQNQEAGLAELARVLEPRGRMVIIEPDIRRFAVKLVRLAEAILGMGSRFRSAAEIIAMLHAGVCGRASPGTTRSASGSSPTGRPAMTTPPHDTAASRDQSSLHNPALSALRRAASYSSRLIPRAMSGSRWANPRGRYWAMMFT